MYAIYRQFVVYKQNFHYAMVNKKLHSLISVQYGTWLYVKKFKQKKDLKNS